MSRDARPKDKSSTSGFEGTGVVRGRHPESLAVFRHRSWSAICYYSSACLQNLVNVLDLVISSRISIAKKQDLDTGTGRDGLEPGCGSAEAIHKTQITKAFDQLRVVFPLMTFEPLCQFLTSLHDIT